jgi:hypothetical protein
MATSASNGQPECVRRDDNTSDDNFSACGGIVATFVLTRWKGVTGDGAGQNTTRQERQRMRKGGPSHARAS